MTSDQAAASTLSSLRRPDNITMEDLIQEMTPKATALVPSEVRKELQGDVKKVLEKHQ